MRILATTALLALLMPVHQLMGQSSDAPAGTTAASDPGFSEALFDSTTVTEILKDGTAVGIRFYNVLVPPGNKDGSAMAVGIRADGSEINTGKAYRISLGFVKGKIEMNATNSKDAKAACIAMQNSGHPSYSAAFTRTELEALTDLDGCQAIGATPDVTATGETTMRLTAMKIVGGKAEPLGQDAKFMRVCGYPCPSVCGLDNNYVYRAPK